MLAQRRVEVVAHWIEPAVAEEGDQPGHRRVGALLVLDVVRDQGDLRQGAVPLLFEAQRRMRARELALEELDDDDTAGGAAGEDQA